MSLFSRMAAPNAAPQGARPGDLQSFMAQLGQQPAQAQGGGWTRPPTSNMFVAPSHLAPNDFGPITPEAIRDPTGRGVALGDQVMGMNDVRGMPGVMPTMPEGFGNFRSNSPQNGYPTWDAPFQTSPHTPLQGAVPSQETVSGWGGKFSQPAQGGGLLGMLGGMVNPFGGFGGGGGGRKSNADELVIQKLKN